MSKSVTTAIIHLLDKEPFYGHFLAGMRRVYTDKIPTAGVSVTDKVTLYINPKFFESMDESARVAVLKHECHHVMNMHMLRVKNTKTGQDRKHVGFNIAADIAINQYIPNLPKTPDGKNQALGVEFFPNKVKTHESAEYYYDQLQQQKKEVMEKYGNKGEKGEPGGQQGTGAGDVFDDLEGLTTDDHSTWDESTQSKEEMESTVKKAAHDAKQKAKGNVPGDVEQMLEKLFKPTINWKQKLRQFFQASLKYNKERSRKKRNRRYGVLYSGKKKDDLIRVYIGVDSSGSVSDQELQLFFTEIESIAKAMHVKAKVLIADAAIQNSFEYTPGMKIQIKGRGGTAYQPVLAYANDAKESVDGVIYFGDGDAWDTPIKPKYPVLWAFTRKQDNPFSFGHFIKVEEPKG